MNSILFMYIETETEKLSGHIDLTARYPSCRVFNFTNLKLNLLSIFRIQSENFLPYLTGAKQLLPITRDLTYFRSVFKLLIFTYYFILTRFSLPVGRKINCVTGKVTIGGFTETERP